MNSRIALVFALFFVVLAAGMNLVYAGNATSVWAEDSLGTIRNHFNVGETMYIHWNATKGSTVDINVTDSGGNILASWTNQDEQANETLTYKFTKTDYYSIVCDGAPTFPIAVDAPTFSPIVALVLVVPESALGALTAVAVGFAAFGMVKMKRAQKTRID